MSARKISFLLSIGAGIGVILVSLYGFSLLRTRPGLPRGLSSEYIVRIDSIEIEGKEDIEFILSQMAIGQTAVFSLRSDDTVEIVEAPVVPFYSQVPFPYIYLFIGIFCFLIGFAVLLIKQEDEKARIFYWLTLVFASPLIIHGGFYCLRKDWMSYFPGMLFYLLYPLAPALLFRFSLSFSRRRFWGDRLLIYIPAILLSTGLAGAFFLSGMRSSIEIHRWYVSLFYFFRIYLILFVVLAIFHLIICYRKSLLSEEKAQIKWVFWGLCAGLGPFILVYQILIALRVKPVISEEFVSVFFVFIPVAFAFSIFKFKLMDVELVINRSVVYSLLTIFTVSVYLFFVQFFSKFFTGRETAVSLVSVLLAAAVFHPARRRIQTFVDKAFFRQSYDFRKTILRFNEKAQRMIHRDHLVDFFIQELSDILPLERLGIFIYGKESNGKEIIVSRGNERVAAGIASLDLPSETISARKNSVAVLDNIEISLDNVLEELQMEMIIPLPFEASALSGVIVLGKKKSGERFTVDDIELLKTIAGELTLNLERIRLQEEIVYERTLKEKLDELSRLKTEFISTVSHEIRTPMSSIQGLTEILQSGKIKDKAKREEFLDLIASESGRLSRLLHNILDFGKIEQQMKSYAFEKTEVGSVIEEAMGLFRRRLEADGFDVKVSIPESPLFLKADRDAIEQVLINLIDNAIKYSADKKYISVRVIESDQNVEIWVTDQGVGIASDEQEKIFEKFYRVKEASFQNPEGVGLGLKIVKHIIASHGGYIELDSEPGRGSTFKLIFPKNEKNINC